MAADILIIQIKENGVITETTIYNPELNVLWTEVALDSLILYLGLANHPTMEISFPSLDYLTNFKTSLDIAVSSGTGTVTLDNLGPVVMITTTSTTTIPETTTTTTAATTTTTTAEATTTTTTAATTTTTTAATTTTTTAAPVFNLMILGQVGGFAIENGEPNEIINLNMIVTENPSYPGSLNSLTFNSPVSITYLDSLHDNRDGTITLDGSGRADGIAVWDPISGYNTGCEVRITGRSIGSMGGVTQNYYQFGEYAVATTTLAP